MGWWKRTIFGEFNSRLPRNILQSRTIDNYIEPFLGGGAMFFFLRKNYNIKTSYLFDVNKELIVGYKAIKNNLNELIDQLCSFEKEYHLK